MTDSVARMFSLAALEAGSLEKQVTVQQDVGGITAGTVYDEGTPLSKIITDMLGGSSPTTVTIYYGATNEKPTSIASLTQKSVSSTSLVGTYTQTILSGDETTKKSQYPVFAIPSGYEVTKWCASGFEYDIPHTLIVNGGYNIYYLNNKSYDVDLGGITYKINI